MNIDNPLETSLVLRLIESQFPKWKGLPIFPVKNGGWDHVTFRLGNSIGIRLPRSAEYAFQVEKEHRWLPFLADRFSMEIPKPIELGIPSEIFPYPWLVFRWIEGEDAVHAPVEDWKEFAKILARFLLELQTIDPTSGPSPGEQNFFRGGFLRVYDEEARQAIKRLASQVDSSRALDVWREALHSIWDKKRVWVHGDISPGNLIVRNGKLKGVIDFGLMSIGDPACDLAISWMFFDRASRKEFLESFCLDPGLIARAKGWALWKAAITASGLAQTNALKREEALSIIESIIYH